METSTPSNAFETLRLAARLSTTAGRPDGQLLGSFIEHRDDDAFATLVRRHGPMVWGVCRRLLDHHAAEDAFQATFLVLVRKASSVVPREMVGNWLYGVAHRVALQARRTAARRTRWEKPVTEMFEPAVTEHDLPCDLQQFLDWELRCLPDTYRSVLVLCDMEGKTRREVARQLGVPEGSVAGWLVRGRATLAKRLARRGVAMPAGALAVVLGRTAQAGVPASVLSSTIRSASVSAAGSAMTTDAIPLNVVALTEGVLKAMMVSRLKLGMAVLLVLFCIGSGAAFLPPAVGQPPPAQKKVESAKAAAVQRRPVETDQEKLEGRWGIVSVAVGGKSFKTADKPDELKDIDLNDVLIKGDRLTPTRADAVNSCWHGNFKLDGTRDPKQITIHDEGPDGKLTFRGIYSMEGDALKVCINGDGTDVCRPEEFVTRKGSAVFIVTFKKVPAKK